MIKSLEAKGVHGRFNFSVKFHPDVNILTGKNGAGKTTVLKLVWYLLSGNIQRLCSEITFDRVKLEADEHDIVIEKTMLGDRQYKMACWLDGQDMGTMTSYNANEMGQYDPLEFARDNPFSLMSSRFFPTFRRIEGGYGIEHFVTNDDMEMTIVEALRQFSRALNTRRHKFIIGIAAQDINFDLGSGRSLIFESVDKLQIKRNQEALDKIKAATTEKEKIKVLDEIKGYLTEMQADRTAADLPFQKFWEIIHQLLGYDGINFESLYFGRGAETEADISKAISSNILSSGEKQIVSFFAYNALMSKGCLFIDEPEISLHPDWQRKLIPMLAEQNPSNQLIISTHSPFIYSFYADRELLIHSDKGE